MADDLLVVYSSPGPVDLAEFTDWYDNEPGYKAAMSTPWRQRITASASGREKRVFGLHKSFA
jgi:hypothetical protein